jgi:hypothetical protein
MASSSPGTPASAKAGPSSSGPCSSSATPRPPLEPGTLTGLPHSPFELVPNGPVLILAPGDLHQQIREEGWTHFRCRLTSLDSQDAFEQLITIPGTCRPRLDPTGKPILAPGFYLTSYTQLTTNGVAQLPDPQDWDPRALQQFLCLPTGDTRPTIRRGDRVPNPTPQNPLDLAAGRPYQPTVTACWGDRPDFEDACHFFAWRHCRWANAYQILQLDPDDTLGDLAAAVAREQSKIDQIDDDRCRAKTQAVLDEARAVLEQLTTPRGSPTFAALSDAQQDFVLREYCAERIEQYSGGIGTCRDYPIGPFPEGYDPEKPETDTRLKRRIKCLYSPSLADLSYNAFDAMVIDEGVRMKGEDTYVGKGVRSMEPPFRLILTATPVKNRPPDIFRLAWWAAGGKADAHAR